jgi:hypothetical protein
MRDRSINFDGLLRDALLPLTRQVLKGPHVMQPVGQLHNNDADVVHHREQHLADALGLAFLARIEMQFAQLGDAVHAARHFFAESLPNLIDRDLGVFNDVVQQAGFEADHVHLHVGQDQRDIQRMDQVRLARFTNLVLMGIRGHAVSLFQLRQVVLGPEQAHFLLKLSVQLLDQTSGRDDVGGHYTSRLLGFGEFSNSRLPPRQRCGMLKASLTRPRESDKK